jgi:hypothetical protein
VEAPLEELVALRYDHIARSPVYPGGEAARAMHTRYVLDGLQRGDHHLRLLRAPGGRLQAFALAWQVYDPMRAATLTHVLVHREESEAALGWLAGVLPGFLAPLADDLEAGIPAWDAPLRGLLEASGLSLQSVVLAGRVERALARLVARYDPPRALPGVALVPMQPGHIDALVALHRRVFSAAPQFCWFGASDAFLEGYRAYLESPPPGPRLVALEGGEVAGYLASRFNLEDPHHGRSAGMDLILDERLRGRGLSKVAYRLLLEAMVAGGIEWIKGTTGQPPVLKLARVMGREAYVATLSRRGFFPAGWFDVIL